VLVGGARFSSNITASELATSNEGASGSLSSSQTNFAFSPGVGMDVNVNSRIAIRAFQIDYLMTHLYNRRQDNARISAGFLIHIGSK
jgi:hypothetical protein